MKTYSLYKSVNKKTKDIYSKQKYGDIESLNYFANLLNKLIISNNLLSAKTVLFVGVKYPYSSKYKKNFVILTEKIAKLNKLPIVYAYYRYKYDSISFYDDHVARKAAVPKLSNNDKKRYKNYHFIVIEDSIITSNTMKAVKKCLKGVSKKVSLVTIFDLRRKKISEKDLNNYFFEMNGTNGLANLLNSINYVPTTQMLRTLDSLGRNELILLLKSIPKPKQLKESYKSYTNKKLML